MKNLYAEGFLTVSISDPIYSAERDLREAEEYADLIRRMPECKEKTACAEKYHIDI